MVVYFRFAVCASVHRNRSGSPDVVVELAASGNIRDKGDYILAGGWFADTFEAFVRRFPQKAETVLRTPETLGTLEKMA